VSESARLGISSSNEQVLSDLRADLKLMLASLLVLLGSAVLEAVLGL